MLEEMATVVQREAQGVWVSTEIKSGCSACQQQEHCSSGMVARAFTPKQTRFFLATEKPLGVGAKVRIGIDQRMMTQSALLVYLLPLVVFILAMAGAVTMQWSELLQLIVATASAAATLFLVRQYENNRAKGLDIALLAVVAEAAVVQSSAAVANP